MKKVFFIMSTDDYSGAEAVNFSIIKHLKEKYDFYWVSRKGNINNFLEKNDINYINIEKLSTKEIKRIVKENNPDILHCTDYKASCVCALANTGKPIFAHLHNNSPWLRKLHPFSFLLLYCSKKFDKILTVSSSIENEYIFSKFVKNKIMNIGNPVSVNEILEKKSNLNSNKEYDICCTARLTPQKNPLRFINIISKIKNKIPGVRVVWIGKGELMDECIKLKNDLGLDKNIDFVGFQNNPYDYMSKAKIFMLTSDWEGYGLVGFEALTLGLPAVVSNVGGLVDIVDESCGKLCNSDEDFINEIIPLLEDSNKLDDKSKKAIERSLKLDNIEKYMKKIDDIYKNSIKE